MHLCDVMSEIPPSFLDFVLRVPTINARTPSQGVWEGDAQLDISMPGSGLWISGMPR